MKTKQFLQPDDISVLTPLIKKIKKTNGLKYLLFVGALI